MSIFRKGYAGYKNLKSKIPNPLNFEKPPAPADAAKASEAPKVVKERIHQRFIAYLKQIGYDYKTMAQDTLKGMDQKPFKALAYGLFLANGVVLYKYNPSEISYLDARRYYLNELIMCHETRNRKSEYYLDELTKLENAKKLEYRSYVFFSLIINKGLGESVNVYEEQCAQLNEPGKWNVFNYFNRLLRFMSKIVDIGYYNKWRYLEKNFIEYDVNEDEFKKVATK